MRQPAKWMTPGTDDRILELIDEFGSMTPLALSKEGMVERLPIGRKHAGNRCRELVKYGLLTRVDKGLYTLTDEGSAYLEGDLDASTLQPVN